MAGMGKVLNCNKAEFSFTPFCSSWRPFVIVVECGILSLMLHFYTNLWTENFMSHEVQKEIENGDM